MSIRATAARVSVIGIMVGVMVATATAPASAMPSTGVPPGPNQCTSMWGAAHAAQLAMETSVSTSDFWYFHNVWADALSWISANC